MADEALTKTNNVTARVAHPVAHFAKGWGIARSATAFFCATTILSAAHAQSASCGLTSFQESTPLIYPPIAKAAHVTGTVVLLAAFDLTGKVTSIRALSGPLMLQGAAINYVKNWQANSFTGPRECPVSVTYRVVGVEAECGSKDDHSKLPIDSFKRIDVQHVVITRGVGCYTTQY